MVPNPGCNHHLPLRVVLLTAGAVAVWAHAAWFALASKSGMLDDAYIYLHMANNVIEGGTARYFPIADSAALLASSPLRLIVLLPSVLLSRLLAEPRGDEAARLAFLMSGPLTAALFLPFFRRRMMTWGVGLVASGVLAVCTESALQMEGLLLFWILLRLVCPEADGAADKPGRLGVLLGMLLLTRPEYGLPALAAGAVWAARGGRRRRLWTWLAGATLTGCAWIAVAAALRVYPLPTSYLTKVLTGRIEMFGASFGTLLPVRIGEYFSGSASAPVWFAWALAVPTAAAVACGSWRRRLVGVLLVVVCVLTWQAGGNYLWYYENVFIGLAALALGGFVSLNMRAADLRAMRLPIRLATVWFAVLMAAFTTVNWGEADRTAIWGLRSRTTAGFGYFNIGRAVVGPGLFAFPGTAPTYLVMTEIGMVSYFAGADAWLYDRGGLAQPGTLAGTDDHILARLYPHRLLVKAGDELRYLDGKYRRDQAPPPVWVAWSRHDDDAFVQCDIYLPDQSVCLQSAGPRSERQPAR